MFAEPAQNRPDQIGVVERQDLGRRLDHVHLRPQAGVGRPEFEADIATAHDHKLFRQFGQRQGLGGGNDPATEREGRKLDGIGAGGDDNGFGADDLQTGFGFHLHGLPVAEAASP